MKFLRQFMIILLLSFLGEVLKMFIPLPIPASDPDDNVLLILHQLS